MSKKKPRRCYEAEERGWWDGLAELVPDYAEFAERTEDAAMTLLPGPAGKHAAALAVIYASLHAVVSEAAAARDAGPLHRLADAMRDVVRGRTAEAPVRVPGWALDRKAN